MEYGKLQIGCLLVLLYVGGIFIRECRRYHEKLSETKYDTLLCLGIISVTFDLITAYTVNHLEQVPSLLNLIFHGLFFVALDGVVFALFVYMFFQTGNGIQKKKTKILLSILLVINMAYIFLTMPYMEYIEGKITNYSMGLPVYGCYAVAALYIVMTLIVLFYRWNYIEAHKQMGVLTYVIALAVITGCQAVFPEILATSLGVTIMLLGIYLNMEAPSFRALTEFHGETVMSFATLIENKDNSTGGHVKRTSRYVDLICQELVRENKYPEILSKDYITCLGKAAPMHDVGKVAVPDRILQKPGKLTDEEFDSMKKHAPEGGEIVLEIFQNLGDEEYRHMAYDVARHHHEKWNGKGYPDGLKQEEIPLCARIMAVADVFDAVSQKRCYRDAMPLEECFAIIEEGMGKDFDPVIARAFLNDRSRVEAVYYDYLKNSENSED